MLRCDDRLTRTDEALYAVMGGRVGPSTIGHAVLAWFLMVRSPLRTVYTTFIMLCIVCYVVVLCVCHVNPRHYCRVVNDVVLMLMYQNITRIFYKLGFKCVFGQYSKIQN